MTLPQEYLSYSEYFRDSISFLKGVDFLFKHSNIAILTEEILQKFPESWIHCIQNLTAEQLVNLSSSKNINLFDGFFEKKMRFSPNSEDVKIHNNSPDSLPTKQKLLNGMNPKKQHEIFAICERIHEQCLLKDISLVVDLGSGLGYLSQLLHEKYGYYVLGIEGNMNNVNSALKRQEKLFKSSSQFVKYAQHYVSEISSNKICEFISNLFPKEQSFLIVGLHACGDLTINATKLFLDINWCKAIFIMPCCYHKMCLKLEDMTEHKKTKNTKCSSGLDAICSKFSDPLESSNAFRDSKSEHEENINQKFHNFPLSKALKEIFEELEAANFLKRPFLRLGCQRSQYTWEEQTSSKYELRVFHLLSRAVLELHASKEGAKLVKQKQKAVRKAESSKGNFQCFLDDAIRCGYKLEKNNKSVKVHTQQANNQEVDFSRKPSSNAVDALLSEEVNNTKTIEFDPCKIYRIWNSLPPQIFDIALLFITLQDSLQGLCENIILLDKLAYLSEFDNILSDYNFVKVTNDKISPRCYALVANKK